MNANVTNSRAASNIAASNIVASASSTSSSSSSSSSSAATTWQGRQVGKLNEPLKAALDAFQATTGALPPFVLDIVYDYACRNIGEELIAYANSLYKNDESDAEKKYVIEVAKDPAFVKNPEQYMKDWEEKRGHTEEYRIPEDPARTMIGLFLKEKGIGRPPVTTSAPASAPAVVSAPVSAPAVEDTQSTSKCSIQ